MGLCNPRKCWLSFLPDDSSAVTSLGAYNQLLMHKIISEVALLKIESNEGLMNHYDYLNNLVVIYVWINLIHIKKKNIEALSMGRNGILIRYLYLLILRNAICNTNLYPSNCTFIHLNIWNFLDSVCRFLYVCSDEGHFSVLFKFRP